MAAIKVGQVGYDFEGYAQYDVLWGENSSEVWLSYRGGTLIHQRGRGQIPLGKAERIENVTASSPTNAVREARGFIESYQSPRIREIFEMNSECCDCAASDGVEWSLQENWAVQVVIDSRWRKARVVRPSGRWAVQLINTGQIYALQVGVPVFIEPN